MNLDAATATLRALAAIAGVPNPDAVSIAVTPYKGHSARVHRGWRTATAMGWPSGTRRPGLYAAAASEEAAINALVSHARFVAEYALVCAAAKEQRLLGEARKATEAAAALNVEARRAALLAAQ